MKEILYTLLIVGFLVGCDKNNDNPEYVIVDDIYNGYFTYNGNDYWSSIDFNKNKYIEWPSGGAYYQKDLMCLTVGQYSIDGDKMIFELDSFKFKSSTENDICNSDLLLPGEYVLRYLKNDSLIIENESGTISYYLKREHEK